MSNLYNMVNGVSPSTFLVLPMLGKHPDFYPRFRDCFTGDPSRSEFDHHIFVYTRTGGPGNRSEYEEQNASIESLDGFIESYDDKDDSSYAFWVFNVPDEWRSDYEKIEAGEIGSISPEYLEQLKSVYPKLSEQFDAMCSS